jgi:transglutaminase-like putative cysteine protease
MNVHVPLDSRVHDSRMWWVMVAGCAARFSAERSFVDGIGGFAFWMAVFVGCWLARAWTRGRSDGSQSQQTVGNAIAVAGIVLFLLRLNSDGVVPALLVFLFAIQAAVFVTATKRLHAWLILAAALGGLLFAASESRSSLFLLPAAWFTFAALSLLVSDHRFDREREMLTVAQNANRRTSGGIAFAALALAVALPLYLFVPKPDGLMLGGMQARAGRDYRDGAPPEPAPQPADDAGEGFDPELDSRFDGADSSSSDERLEPRAARPELGDYGEEFSPNEVRRDRAIANDILMYVKSSRPVYLRGVVYDRFENDRWHRDPRAFAQLPLRRGYLEVRASFGDERVQQTIEIARDLPSTTVWHAPGLRRLRFAARAVRHYDDDVFEALQPLRGDTLYSVESYVEFRDGRYALLEAEPKELERYLRTDAASEQVRALARSVTAGSETPLEKAIALETHLRERYQYTYETLPQQGYTPLDTFLFETKRGHCEYFASALAMMLRAVNVPARVVGGFSLGERNPATGYYEVRRLDGHAWVEAYVDGGWLMLEPTPFYPLPRPETDHQVAAQMERYLERLAQTSELLDPEALTTTLAEAMRDAWRSMRWALHSLVAEIRLAGWRLLVGLAGVVALLALGYVAVLAIADGLDNRRVRETLSRARSAETGAAVLLAVGALEAAGQQRGFARLPSASFREYAASLVGMGIALPAEFAEHFDHARYGSSLADGPHARTDELFALVEARLRDDPLPRVRRALQSWRSALSELIGRN